jgi:hypothetical protein
LQQYGFICFVLCSVSAHCTQVDGHSTFRRVQWVKPTNEARVCGFRFWLNKCILDMCPVPRCEAHAGDRSPHRDVLDRRRLPPMTRSEIGPVTVPR